MDISTRFASGKGGVAVNEKEGAINGLGLDGNKEMKTGKRNENDDIQNKEGMRIEKRRIK